MSPLQQESRGRIVPVIDVMDGQVVRAVGGRRELYQPLTSKITSSTDPAVAANAMLRTVGVNELYVADIYGLMGHRPRLGWIGPLCESGVRVMVDSGVRHPEEARSVFDSGATAVIAATETLESARRCFRFRAHRLFGRSAKRESCRVGSGVGYGAGTG